jgi:A/G-specific adenine glycosylase
LYCFVLFDDRVSLQAALPQCLQNQLHDAPVVKHVLTHKDLHLHPVRVVLPQDCLPSLEGLWFEKEQWPQLGLPAPVRKLLAA